MKDNPGIEKPGEKKKIPLPRKLLFIFFNLIILLFLAEGGIRLYYLVSNKKFPQARKYHKKLGWRTAANVKYKRRFKGYGVIKYSTSKHGFRVYGDVNTSKSKILVLGDSQTQARKISDGKTYYHYIKRNTDTEIFAYGSGGYGSLQEYMILDGQYDKIKPGIIIWQFHQNDFYNNSWKLECSSKNNNNHMTRPYYIDGKIKMLYPHSSWIYRNVLRHSYLARLSNINFNILLADKPGKGKSNLLYRNNHVFVKAVDTTSEIMNLVRNRVGNTPIIAFSGGGGDWSEQIFSDICKKFNMFYIHGIPGKIQEAEKSGLRVNGLPYDPHWNNTGHSIVGKIIVDYLIEKGFLKNISY